MNWKIIEEFPRYEISDTGVCRNKETGLVLKATKSGNRYLVVELCAPGVQKMRMIHRLVALAFLPNPQNLPYVNHKDFDPLNNRIENLEWVDARGNYQHSAKAGRYIPKKRRSHAKFTDSDIETIRYEWDNKTKRVGQIAKERKVSSSLISNIVYRKVYTKVFHVV